MQCPQCQQAAPADADFCPACGSPLLVTCPACETRNAPTHRFCKRCGRALVAPAGAAAPLPAPPAPAAPVSAPSPAPPPEAEAGEAGPGGRPLLVLVGDDDPAIRELVADVLAEAGFRTARATNGEEVVELAVRQKPALIVLDVIMPKMDGYTTLIRLRGNRVTQDIPVVILTGQPGPIYQTLSYGAGATAHITKPFSPRQLMDTVERVLSGKPP
jgi:CheY-like chemotaxis protein